MTIRYCNALFPSVDENPSNAMFHFFIHSFFIANTSCNVYLFLLRAWWTKHKHNSFRVPSEHQAISLRARGALVTVHAPQSLHTYDKPYHWRQIRHHTCGGTSKGGWGTMGDGETTRGQWCPYTRSIEDTTLVSLRRCNVDILRCQSQWRRFDLRLRCHSITVLAVFFLIETNNMSTKSKRTYKLWFYFADKASYCIALLIQHALILIKLANTR